MNTSNGNKLAVAVAGLGAIGYQVARQLDRGIPGCELVSVAASDRLKAEIRLQDFSRPVAIRALDELPATADVVVECLPAGAFRSVALPTLRERRTLLAISSAALLEADDVLALARNGNGRIVVASGALMGLDALAAMAEGDIRSARLITRKSPAGLQGAPYLVQNKIDLEGLKEPRLIFRGSARKAAQAFPANVNVGATLSLATIGPDRTEVEIWAVPGLSRNTHAIEVVSDSATLSASIENLPSVENPRSSRITALSVIATLRRLTTPIRFGS